ncbi:hypothetical protein D0T53_03795 [Dysgonomonas sp. 216]|uniref:hypothetical protein n=1 Tax=Dysgonomonas sp. 216 TaxID=2302934 RepID=UPI0013D04A0D|nr:hypothetical protein [Dysgonomonas sp. 216]NDW18039.1 hypothetical protein [Dysgonomonas sp. 216]
MKKDMFILFRYIGASIVLVFACTSPIFAQISGDYPYFESFLSGNQPDGIITPMPEKNSVTFKKKGAVLTPEPADFGKFGAIILNNHSFDASAGIFISFEYMIYGGNGGDGMSVFFFDASATPHIGAVGGGIGYTYNRSYNGSAGSVDFTKFRAIGLNGAYLGIALDSYGNFKNAFYQGESRVSGLPYIGYGMTGGIDLNSKNTKDDVTLRGAMSPTSAGSFPGMGIGYAGYPVLVTQSTVENIGHRLKNGGNYAWEQYPQLKPETVPFPIKGGYQYERPGDAGYRRAYIELFPNTETGEGGFYISVMIENENRRDTIIDNYLYRQSFRYLENAMSINNSGDNDGADGMPRASSLSKVLDATVPSALKIGFAAATGDSKRSDAKNDTHVIKNVKLILPRAAEAYDDFLPDHFRGVDAEFHPLLNDIGYTGTIRRIQGPCPECIDEQTFRFVLDDGTEIYDDGSNTIVYAMQDTGVWTYNKLNGKVLFDPNSNFLGEARIRYNIKGGKGGEYPYNQESYRSTPATLGVNYIIDPNPPGSTFMISNKMVTSRTKK